MPRPPVDHEPYRDQIIDWYSRGTKINVILQRLKDLGLKSSRETLRTRLRSWQVAPQQQRVDYTDRILLCRIAVLFYDWAFRDKDILFALRQEGCRMKGRTLRRLRMMLGLRRKVDIKNIDQENEELLRIVQEELDRGTILPYGRTLLYAHFRSRHHNVAR